MRPHTIRSTVAEFAIDSSRILDEDAVRTVATLAADLGFEPLVAGDISAASHLEGIARFWIHLSREHGRDIGFRLLRDGEPGS